MIEARCKNNMCTRLYMPLSLAFAKSIHSFQGATVGPKPPGRPENAFLRVVADPGVNLNLQQMDCSILCCHESQPLVT